VYHCVGEDRWVAISILDDEAWARFASLVGEPWTADSRLVRSNSRLEHAAELDESVERWTSLRSPEEVTALCQRYGVAAFTVANGEDFCARDPHLQARGYWARVRGPDGRTVVLDGVPARLSETPGFVDSPGPLHGEHTDRVLTELLDLDGAEIATLRAAQVVA
jgi:crotonobetainyl-CoA:carnitine CoA-transferase CaiB-like acyl-CoA transferase